MGIVKMILGTSWEVNKERLAEAEKIFFDGDCVSGCMNK